MVTQFFRCEQLAEAALFGGSCPFNELGAQNVVGCVCRWLEEVPDFRGKFGGQRGDKIWSAGSQCSALRMEPLPVRTILAGPLA